MSEWLEIYLWGALINVVFTGVAAAQVFGHTTFATGWRLGAGLAFWWIVGCFAWPILLPLMMLKGAGE